MTNNKLTTRELVELSLFSALIALSIQFFRIPVGPQFIHFGNALVVGLLSFTEQEKVLWLQPLVWEPLIY